MTSSVKSPFLFVIAALGLFVSSASTPARAGDLMDFIANLAGGGANADEDQYKERSPLVVPPSSTLPKPKQKAQMTDPSWPKDPDVLKREKAAKGEDGLEPGELVARIFGGSVADAHAQAGEPVLKSDADPSKPLSPQDMARASEIMKQVAAKNNALNDNGGPRALTSPPKQVAKKAVITPDIEAATAAATGANKPWYQFW